MSGENNSHPPIITSNKIALVITEVQRAENINQIKNLKKLKGSS